jgi:hypothetical protein
MKSNAMKDTSLDILVIRYPWLFPVLYSFDTQASVLSSLFSYRRVQQGDSSSLGLDTDLCIFCLLGVDEKYRAY